MAIRREPAEHARDVRPTRLVPTLDGVDRRQRDEIHGDEKVHVDRLGELERIARERSGPRELAERQLEDRERTLTERHSQDIAVATAELERRGEGPASVVVAFDPDQRLRVCRRSHQVGGE